MAGGLKLEDLNWGTCNDLSDTNQSQLTGDPRRTSPLQSVQQATELAFLKDAIGARGEYNGFVVDFQQQDFATFQNKAQMFQAWVYFVPGTSGQPKQYENVAYKVYLPELMPQPAPHSDWKAEQTARLLVTYPNVYSALDNQEAIPKGSFVTVRFDDPTNLVNPRIVKILERSVGVVGLSTDANGNYLKTAFLDGIPVTVAAGTGGPGAASHNPKAKTERYSDETHPSPTRKIAPDRGAGSYYPVATWAPTYNWSNKGKKNDVSPSRKTKADVKYIIMHTTEIWSNNGSKNTLRGFIESRPAKHKDKMRTGKQGVNYIFGIEGQTWALTSDLDNAFHIGKGTGLGPGGSGPQQFSATNSIGIEVVGRAEDPTTWYKKTDQGWVLNYAKLRKLAGLIAYLADKFDIPLVYYGLPKMKTRGFSRGPYSEEKYGIKTQRVEIPKGTGRQYPLSKPPPQKGVYAHGRASLGRRSDPGVHFPWKYVMKEAAAKSKSAHKGDWNTYLRATAGTLGEFPVIDGVEVPGWGDFYVDPPPKEKKKKKDKS